MVATFLMSWDRTLAVTIRLTSSSRAEKEGGVVAPATPEEGENDGAGVPDTGN